MEKLLEIESSHLHCPPVVCLLPERSICLRQSWQLLLLILLLLLLLNPPPLTSSTTSSSASVTCGEPQGSFVGPILFALYMFPGSTFHELHFSYQCYTVVVTASSTCLWNPPTTRSLPSSHCWTALKEVKVCGWHYTASS